MLCGSPLEGDPDRVEPDLTASLEALASERLVGEMPSCSMASASWSSQAQGALEPPGVRYPSNVPAGPRGATYPGEAAPDVSGASTGTWHSSE